MLSIWWRYWDFFAKKGWERSEWSEYILIPWTPGPPHLILAHPHTHDIYTRLIFIIAKKAVVLHIKFSSFLKNFNFIAYAKEKKSWRKKGFKKRKKQSKNCIFWIKTSILRRKTVIFNQKRSTLEKFPRGESRDQEETKLLRIKLLITQAGFVEWLTGSDWNIKINCF